MNKSREMGSIVKTSAKVIWKVLKAVFEFLIQMTIAYVVLAYIVLAYYGIVYITVKFVEIAIK